MHALAKFFHKQQIVDLQQEAYERMLGEAVFTEWRDRYIAELCKHIRLLRDAKERGLKTGLYPPDRDWCNAAVQILTHADITVQDYFLRAAEPVKNEMICAVLADGGVTRLDGFFVELPPV